MSGIVILLFDSPYPTQSRQHIYPSISQMNFLSSCFGSKSNLNENLNSDSPTVKSAEFASKPSDEEIIQFENELRKEEASTGPLVSPALPIAILQDEFPESNFALKLEKLETEFNFGGIRKCRRDGNCFYRAVAFGLIETFRKDPQTSAEQFKESWKNQLKSVGYEPVIYEDFSDSFWSFVEENSAQTSLNLQEAWEIDEYTSNMALMLLRLLTSAHIRSNPDDYLAFIELGPQDANSIEKWCERCVDAVGVDADQVQLIALAKTLGILIVVANLGGGQDSEDLQVNEFDFRVDNMKDPRICLLYRPGHYDLLYKK